MVGACIAEIAIIMSKSGGTRVSCQGGYQAQGAGDMMASEAGVVDGLVLWFPSLYPRDTADAAERTVVHPSLKYLDHIRSLPCLGSKTDVRPIIVVCTGRAEPHHLLKIGMGGDRRKPNIRHYVAIPVCREHHDEIHYTGPLEEIENLWGIDIWKWAFRNYLRWLDNG